MGATISCVFHIHSDFIMTSLSLYLGLRIPDSSTRQGVFQANPGIGIIAAPAPPVIKPNRCCYFHSLVCMKYFLRNLKQGPSQSSFVNMYYMLSFTEMWRASILLKWAHYRMWFSYRLRLFIPFFVGYFDHSTQAGWL